MEKYVKYVVQDQFWVCISSTQQKVRKTCDFFVLFIVLFLLSNQLFLMTNYYYPTCAKNILYFETAVNRNWLSINAEKITKFIINTYQSKWLGTSFKSEITVTDSKICYTPCCKNDIQYTTKQLWTVFVTRNMAYFTRFLWSRYTALETNSGKLYLFWHK